MIPSKNDNMADPWGYSGEDSSEKQHLFDDRDSWETTGYKIKNAFLVCYLGLQPWGTFLKRVGFQACSRCDTTPRFGRVLAPIPTQNQLKSCVFVYFVPEASISLKST